MCNFFVDANLRPLAKKVQRAVKMWRPHYNDLCFRSSSDNGKLMMLWAKSRLTKYGDAFISGADPVHAFNCIPGTGDRDDDDDEGDGEGGNDDANCKQFGQKLLGSTVGAH